MWCALEERDRQLAALTHTLWQALSIDTLLPIGVSRADNTQADSVVELLCEALDERLDDDLVLVLDDVHELAPGSPAARLLAGICRQAPPRLHVVCGSRTTLPFPTERLRGRGQAAAIEADALRFTRAEVASLVGDDRLAAGLHELTEGWPAAVRLAAESMRAGSSEQRADTLELLGQADGALFPYLAEEVFEGERPVVRRLLRTVAQLERFTAEECVHLGVRSAQRVLADLRRRGLFVHADGDGWYSLHALVREFVLRAWPLSPGQADEIRGLAAAWLLESGQPAEALRLALESRHEPTLRAILVEHREELLVQGAADELLRAGELLGPGRDPEIEVAVGDVLTVKGRFEAARKRYEQAAAAGGGALPPALAWRIGRCHWDQGQYREALTAYRRGRLDGSDPLHETLLLTWKTIVIWNQIGAEGAVATAEEAAATAELALAQARVAGTDRALAAGHYAVALAALGHDDVVAESNARLALDYAEGAGDALHTVRIRLLLAGLTASFDSIEIADPAVRTAEIAGADLYLAAALLCRGTARLQVGQLDAALADFKSALWRSGSCMTRHGRAGP